MSKTWTGFLEVHKTVDFTVKGKRGGSSYGGRAAVYRFTPDDPKCKVRWAAAVSGVPHEKMCSASGDVGQAIMEKVGLWKAVRNAGVNGCYDTFPDPIGCPADRLQNRDVLQTLTFYGR